VTSHNDNPLVAYHCFSDARCSIKNTSSDRWVVVAAGIWKWQPITWRWESLGLSIRKLAGSLYICASCDSDAIGGASLLLLVARDAFSLCFAMIMGQGDLVQWLAQVLLTKCAAPAPAASCILCEKTSLCVWSRHRSYMVFTPMHASTKLGCHGPTGPAGNKDMQ
jgi:hypothetical protein